MKTLTRSLTLAFSLCAPVLAAGPVFHPAPVGKADFSRLGKLQAANPCPKGWKTVVNRSGDPNAFRSENAWIIKCKPDVTFPRSMECPQKPSITDFVIDRERMEIGCKTRVR